MALLRASSKAVGEEADLSGAVGEADSGIVHGDLMVAFATAATRGEAEQAELRRRLIDAIGPARFVEVAATVGIFNGLVRVADSSGIPLDNNMVRASSGFREELGLNAFSGAGNTDLSAPEDSVGDDDVSALFGN